MILLAPVFIAVYRFHILARVTSRYALDLSSSRFQSYCVWAIALFLLSDLLEFWLLNLSLGDSEWRPVFANLAWLAVSALWCGVILLFPAIAVDALGATLRNALADARSSFWHIVAIWILVAVPIWLIWILVRVIDDTLKIEPFVASLVTFCSALLWAAAASRLFVVLADRLRSPA